MAASARIDLHASDERQDQQDREQPSDDAHVVTDYPQLRADLGEVRRDGVPFSWLVAYDENLAPTFLAFVTPVAIQFAVRRLA